MIIECSSDPSERRGVTHRVIIHPDWTVDVPHDIEAERVARSFGGWSTCLELVERVIPAYRRALDLMTNPNHLLSIGGLEDRMPTRVFRHEIRFEHSPPLDLPGLRDAARREITPDLMIRTITAESAIATKMRAEARHLYAGLFARSGRFWADSGDPRQVEGGAEGFFELWNHGLLPTHIDQIARTIPRVAWPLPPHFFSFAYFGGIGLDWLASVANCFPERMFVMWAATHETWAQTPIDVVWRMNELGLSASDAIGALEQRVSIDTLTTLAHRPGVGGPTAARWLSIWARVGVTPSSDHYRVLEANRVLLERPPVWMLDSTASALRKFGSDAPDRTELAVMLALTSDVELIRAAIRAGVRSATDTRFIQMIHQRSTT